MNLLPAEAPKTKYSWSILNSPSRFSFTPLRVFVLSVTLNIDPSGVYKRRPSRKIYRPGLFPDRGRLSPKKG